MADMTKSLQEIFNRLQERKKQVSLIRKKYKEELATSAEYTKVKEEMDRLRGKKKQYEESLKERAGTSFARADELALSVRQDAQMLSDIAITTIMKGEPVNLRDEHTEYEPVFTVRFKKIK
jgi:predicted nuclease with TOPRIM domain